MRRTDEEFAAEVMRRSSIYRVQKKKQMRRLAAASVSVFAIVLLGGAYWSSRPGNLLMSGHKEATDAASPALTAQRDDEAVSADEAPVEEVPVLEAEPEDAAACEDAAEHMEDAHFAAPDRENRGQEDVVSGEAVSDDEHVLQLRLPQSSYPAGTESVTLTVYNQGTGTETLCSSAFSMKMQQSGSTGYAMFSGTEQETEIPAGETVEWTLQFADFGIPAPAPAGAYTILLEGGAQITFTITE